MKHESMSMYNNNNSRYNSKFQRVPKKKQHETTSIYSNIRLVNHHGMSGTKRENKSVFISWTI